MRVCYNKRIILRIGYRVNGKNNQIIIGQVEGCRNGILIYFVIRSKCTIYIGSTIDLDRRLKEHNQGKTASTRLTRLFKLVFVQEYETIQVARKIEYRLKKKKSRVVIEKIIATGRITIKQSSEGVWFSG